VPAISVILPVFNGQEYLHSAIGSVLSQTFTDFEMLIVDDGSTDESLVIASAFSDTRVRILRNEVNLGLSGSLNLGIEASRADFIARHDQDDIAAPQRLARQIEFMSQHSAVGLVGTWARVLSAPGGTQGEMIREHRHPTADAELRWRLLWNSPFVHSSVMMRRDVLLRAGGYTTSQDRSIPEDYDLWVRMSRVCSLANIPEFLQTYRETPTGMSRARRSEIARGVTRISCSLLQLALPGASDQEVTGLSLSLNGQAQPPVSLRAALRRLQLLHRASATVSGFKIRRSLPSYAFTSLRVLRNSLVKRAGIQQ
jgi:hypothetical protein